MIFPRGRGALRRYGRNKVVAILVTFAIFTIYLKVFVPRGVILSKREWQMAGPSARQAFDRRWSGVVIGVRATVEGTIADTTLAGAAPADAGRVLGRAKVRTTTDHPLVLLYDRDETDGPLQAGDAIEIRGIYDWTTGGGSLRAVRADSSAFGVERRGRG